MKINDLLSENFSDDDIKRELKIPSNFRMKGYVYVLSNESMPGIYKIGMTERSVEERVKELSKMTAIPTPFKIEACFYSNNPLADEQQIHDLLSEYRVSESREFFKSDLQKITWAIREVLELERNDDLTSVVASYDMISLGDESEKCVSEILDSDDSTYIGNLGNDEQAKNLLVKIGAKYLLDILNKHGVSLVLMPDNDIQLVRSIDEQFQRGELK